MLELALAGLISLIVLFSPLILKLNVLAAIALGVLVYGLLQNMWAHLPKLERGDFPITLIASMGIALTVAKIVAIRPISLWGVLYLLVTLLLIIGGFLGSVKPGLRFKFLKE